MSSAFETTQILGRPYAELDYESACDVISAWSAESTNRVIVVAPVSSLVMAQSNREMADAFERADMITCDGVPIVWMRRLLGRPAATRLYGPELMLRVLERAQHEAIPVALVGGRPERLEGLVGEIGRRYPGCELAYTHSPPFRDLSDDEVARMCEDIAVSGARIVFVAVGSPKQEILMRRMAQHLPCVQIGVGAAFDFIPGYVRQAPAIVQRAGLEWAFRLACEPRRLWKRYATTIPPFVFAAAHQLVRGVYAGRSSYFGVAS